MYFIVILIVLAFFILTGSFFVVRQQTIGIVERFGRFSHIAKPGLNFKLPFIDRVVHRLNVRVQQLDVDVETKTLDDVFVNVKVAVQYQVMPDKVYEAFYKLTNIHDQISAYVFDVVRARVPQLKLDDVFSKKEDIAVAVKHELHDTMDDFGYDILKALVTDIDPDERVKNAMNEINAATRLRMAAVEKGEAERILRVKAAEADAQSKALEGKGIADQRLAIIEGLHTSVKEFQRSIEGATAKDVMMIVMLTQYFDTLKEVAGRSNSNTVMLPNSPSGLGSIVDQIRDVLFVSSETAKQPPISPNHKDTSPLHEKW